MGSFTFSILVSWSLRRIDFGFPNIPLRSKSVFITQALYARYHDHYFWPAILSMRRYPKNPWKVPSFLFWDPSHFRTIERPETLWAAVKTCWHSVQCFPCASALQMEIAFIPTLLNLSWSISGLSQLYCQLVWGTSHCVNTVEWDSRCSVWDGKKKKEAETLVWRHQRDDNLCPMAIHRNLRREKD